MKFKSLVVYICVAISVVGCSSNKYKESIEKGNEYLASKEYTKAEESFRLALTEQNDKEIFKLTEQIGSIIDIQDNIKDEEYDKALDICEQVDRNGYSNDIIRKDVTKFKKDIELELNSNKVSDDKGKEAKEVSNNDSNKDNTKEKVNNSSKDKKENDSKEFDIEMAKAVVYNCLAPDYDETDIKVVYVPSSELGDAIPNDTKNNYYVFKVEDRNDGTTWDLYYAYEKKYGSVYQMDINGNLS